MWPAGLSDGAASLLKDFAVALVVAAAGLTLARFIWQPPVLGYLIAGMIIGPFTLPTPLISNLDTIGLLAEMGLILLLFSIGLEMGWRRIRKIGGRVLIIGAVEISVLTLFGIWIASLLPGIEPGHGIYLGCALAISSSAILLKSLRDNGNLNKIWGRTIVGILLVEDFAVVVMLTVLSGLATTGTASLADVGLLAGKLAIFCVVGLVLGAMLGNRLMRVLSGLRSSDETILLVSLGSCFLLALCATLLDLSPAAGAFLVGMIIGDTQASERVKQMIAPVRDMFGALFFLSIGMLIDYRMLDDYIWPALVVVAIFMLGKIAANTLGSILSGLRFHQSLKVGMTMPQMGEFSLAIGRISPGDVAGFSPLGSILTMVTAITSVLAPLTSRSAERVARFVDRFTPAQLTWIVLAVQLGVDAFWSAISLNREGSERFQHVRQTIFINVGIMGFLSAAGTGVLYLAPDRLSDLLSLPTGVVGMIIVGVIIGLCIPSAVVTWRSLGTIALISFNDPAGVDARAGRYKRSRTFRTMVEYGLATVLLGLLFLLTLPLVIRLLTLDVLSIPLSLLLLLSPAVVVGIFSFRIQWVLEEAITELMGSAGEEGADDGEHDSVPEGAETRRDKGEKKGGKNGTMKRRWRNWRRRRKKRKKSG